jgi:hypothetical protein
MKRLLLVFIFSTSLLAIFNTSCCKGYPYWELRDLVMSQTSIAIAGINNSDSLVLELHCQLNFLANHTPLLKNDNPFIGTCTAVSCKPLYGNQGSKDPIERVLVYSNNQISTYAAQLDLGRIIRTEYDNKSRLYNGLSPTMVNESLTEMGLYGENQIPLRLVIIERPIPGTKHVFTIELETKSGQIYTAQTDTITWN